MGNNSSSTIAYGGFFRFQSFSLILTLSSHEIQRIHCEEPMPNLKAWEVEQLKQFFREGSWGRPLRLAPHGATRGATP